MANSEARRERITRGQRGKVVPPDIPDRREQSGHESTRKYSASLQRVDAEDVGGMCGVQAPVVDDVQDLGADDSAQHHQNAEIPGLLAIDALLFGVANADPEAEENAQRNQKTVGR